jgi:hypothetical protein
MNFMIFFPGDQIKKNEMCRACDTCGGERDAQRLLIGKPGEKTI